MDCNPVYGFLTPQLDAPALQAEAERLDEAQKTIGKWLAEKLDISANEFFKEFGKWAGRATVAGLSATALWFFGLLEKLGPLVTHLWHLIRFATGV